MKAASLRDRFDQLDSSKWTVIGGPDFVNSEMVLDDTGEGVVSVREYDLTNSYLYTQLDPKFIHDETPYDPTLTYNATDAVSFEGNKYFARQAVPAGRLPGLGPVDWFNTAEGGTNGTTVTPANSGGASGSAFSTTTISPMVGGSVTYVNSPVYAGNLAILVNVTGVTSGYGGLQSNLANPSKIYTSFWMQSDKMVGTNYWQYLAAFGGGYLIGVQAGIARIQGSSGGVNLATGTVAMANNTWYRWDVYAEVGVGCSINIYDQSGLLLDTITYSGTYLPNTSYFTAIRWGYVLFSSGAKLYLDRMLYSTTAPLRPQADPYWAMESNESGYVAEFTDGSKAYFRLYEGKLFMAYVGKPEIQTTEITFVPSFHRWLRIRERSKVLYFDVSEDGEAWKNIWTANHSADVTKTRFTIRSYANTTKYGEGSYGQDVYSQSEYGGEL